MLCAEGEPPSRTMLGYAEGSLAALDKYCGSLLERKTCGKRAVLAFSEQDDYYTYISHFYPDGAHSLTSGVMLTGGGYLHIAFPFTWVFSAKAVLTHELVHNAIAHLPVPTWLHEGLAQKLERMVVGKGYAFDHEQAEQHRALWNERTIQEFWSGASFYVPDERNRLSYALSELLVELLCEPWERFVRFVQGADVRDAGQDAALQVLERCLGQTVAGFLGPGNWRPQRKAIAEHRSAGSQASQTRAAPAPWGRRAGAE